MRVASIALAVAALVVIGTVESSISVEQLSQLPGRGTPPLGLGGVGLTAASIFASAIVFALLGVLLTRMGQDERGAVRSGMLAGVFAGLIGGSIRAILVRDYLDEVVGGFGLPMEFVSWSLVVFVALSVAVSVAAGAALTWLGFRGARRRPSPRPRS